MRTTPNVAVEATLAATTMYVPAYPHHIKVGDIIQEAVVRGGPKLVAEGARVD